MVLLWHVADTAFLWLKLRSSTKWSLNCRVLNLWWAQLLLTSLSHHHIVLIMNPTTPLLTHFWQMYSNNAFARHSLLCKQQWIWSTTTTTIKSTSFILCDRFFHGCFWLCQLPCPICRAQPVILVAEYDGRCMLRFPFTCGTPQCPAAVPNGVFCGFSSLFLIFSSFVFFFFFLLFFLLFFRFFFCARLIWHPKHPFPFFLFLFSLFLFPQASLSWVTIHNCDLSWNHV